MDAKERKISKRGQFIGMREDGHSISCIAREMGCSRNTVKLWLDRWKDSQTLLDRQRPGKARVTNAEQDKRILEDVERQPITNAVAIRDRLQLGCSPQTVRRRLHEAGHRHWTPVVKETSLERHEEVHFESDQFKPARRNGMKRLKSNAAPTIFPHRPPVKYRKPPWECQHDVLDKDKPSNSQRVPSMEQSCFKHPRLAPSSMSVSPEPIADHEAEPVGDPKPIIYFKAEPIADPEPIIDIKDEPIEDPEPIIDIEDEPIEDPLHIIDHKTEPVAGPEHNNLEAECSTLMISTGPLGNSTDVGKAIFTPCSDLQVGEEIVEMTTTLLTAPHNQSKLQAINKKLSQKVDELEERLANLTGHIQRVYNEDQISAVTRKSTLGHKWSTETIQKAWQIRLACGDGGYETLLGMGFPFPALKTLRRITEESKVSLNHSCDVNAEFSRETRPPLLVGLARVPHPDDVTSK